MNDIIKTIFFLDPNCNNNSIELKCIRFENKDEISFCSWTFQNVDILSLKVDSRIIHLMVFGKETSTSYRDDISEQFTSQINGQQHHIIAKLSCLTPGGTISNKNQLSHRIKQEEKSLDYYKSDIIENFFKFKQTDKKAILEISNIVSYFN